MFEAILSVLAEKGTVAACEHMARALRGLNIKITDPRPGNVLKDPKEYGAGWRFPIRGKLKRLTRHQEIWLLTQDARTGLIWPQGSEGVIYDGESSEWNGLIYLDSGERKVKVIAVCAPPTSQDLFRYFLNVGNLRGQYEAIQRIPPECVNSDSVLVYVPKL
jgi:hypothetical protein